MTGYPFKKQPAFFPFVSAEVFFEAEEAEMPAFLDAKDGALDAELDALLATI